MRTHLLPNTTALLKEIATLHGVTPEILVSHAHPRALLGARIEVAQALDARGYNMPLIGRIMNRDHSTIAFYLGRVALKQPRQHPPSAKLARKMQREAPKPPPPVAQKPRRLIPYAGYDPQSPETRMWLNRNKTSTT